MTKRTDKPSVVYDTTPPTPLRTVDHPDTERVPTSDAQAVLCALVNQTDDQGNVLRASMPAPHAGERMSQRQVARKLLAGRSYQAVQAWIAGEPIPKVTAEWFTEDLQRMDATPEDRLIRVAADEIAIIVKR